MELVADGGSAEPPRHQGTKDGEGLGETSTDRLQAPGQAPQVDSRLVSWCLGGDAVVVRADPAAVEQILFNLVDNACKYAGASGDRRIHLEAARRGGRALLRVRDHGPGVNADVAGRMFRPFSRSAAEAAGSAPGVGLGLALSRRLARDMGGELRLEAGHGGELPSA